MSAAEFHRLAGLADRVRPRDRAEFWRKLDDAFTRATDEARDETARIELYLSWLQLPRERGPSRLSELPQRVAAAVGAAYYAALQEESSQCPMNSN